MLCASHGAQCRVAAPQLRLLQNTAWGAGPPCEGDYHKGPSRKRWRAVSDSPLHSRNQRAERPDVSSGTIGDRPRGDYRAGFEDPLAVTPLQNGKGRRKAALLAFYPEMEAVHRQSNPASCSVSKRSISRRASLKSTLLRSRGIRMTACFGFGSFGSSYTKIT